MIEAGTSPAFLWPLRVTKQQWRIVVISTAAVAFSVTAGLEPPLRSLVNFAKAGTSFIAKQLCSGVLMAGMDPDQMLKEDLADGQGMIHTQIEPSAGRVKASSLFGLIRAEAAQNGERGSKQAYGAHWWLSSRKSRPDLPKESISAEGYQGQLLLVVPSQRAVIMRLGQTPKKPGFDANTFGADVLSALR